MPKNAVIQWLLEGDPAIRWQTQRDLLDWTPRRYTADRKRVATEGWGARLLKKQDEAGTWGGGLYSPKWISTTYTLLLLRHLGLPPENTAARRGCALLIDRGFYYDGGINFFKSLKHSTRPSYRLTPLLFGRSSIHPPASRAPWQCTAE